MAVATSLTPTYPLAFGGYVFPGYTAHYTVILNLVLAVVLTPILNSIVRRGTPYDETVASDYLVQPIPDYQRHVSLMKLRTRAGICRLPMNCSSGRSD